MSRRGWVLLALLAIAGLGVVGGHRFVVQTIEGALTARSVTWQSRSGTTWRALQGPGVTVDQLSLSLWPSPTVLVEGVAVQVDGLSRPSAPSAPSAGAPSPLVGLVSVHASAVSVAWGEEHLASDLSGSIWPVLSLTGPDSEIRRGPEGWHASIHRALTLPHLSGSAQLTVSGAETLSVVVSIPEAVVEHALLAPRALPAQPLRADLIWHRENGALSGTVSLGEAQTEVSGTLSAEPLAFSTTLSAEAIPLAALVALFGDLIPEGRRSDIRGAIGLQAHLQGPPLSWSASVSTDSLAAGGVVSNLEQLKYGVFSWRAPAAGGGTLIRQTGEGHPSWTPLREGMLMGQAAIAAEDARFLAHPGYDIEGINEALLELSAGEERPRGGSTITQQLAKNLFLSGERTVARKLRELLYALELERALGKHRILELYINVVEFGPTLYGVRAASDTYFLKRPSGLAPQEASFLAAILPSPRTWHRRVSQGGRPPHSTVNRILSNMVNTGALDRQTATWAQNEPLVVIPPPP